MILLRLIPALVLLSDLSRSASGNVDLQPANATQEEFSHAGTNQTVSVSTNSTTKPHNVTSSSYEDQKTRIEDELRSNHTDPGPTEDEESFQDQEDWILGQYCHQDQMVQYSHIYCGDYFHQEMLAMSSDDWCVLENVIRPYNELTACLEKLARLINCFFPNPDIQDFFILIHSQYFQNCTKEELLLEDAPHGLVIVLTLIPVSFIPIMVYLVVWKSKVESC